MDVRTSRLIRALGIVLASALFQACAMATGPWAPQRGAAANRNMVSNYDAYGRRIAHQRSVNRTMTVLHDKVGVHDYRYY